MSQGAGKFQKLIIEILVSRYADDAATIAELTSLARARTGRQTGSLRFQVYRALRGLQARDLVIMTKGNTRKAKSPYRVALSEAGWSYAADHDLETD